MNLSKIILCTLRTSLMIRWIWTIHKNRIPLRELLFYIDAGAREGPPFLQVNVLCHEQIDHVHDGLVYVETDLR